MRGFTLLETILALLILSIFITSITWFFFWIIEKNDYYEARKKAEEETLFLNQKINWVLDNSEVLEPLSNSSSTFLKVNKRNFNQNPITIKWQNDSILLSYANGPDISLTSKDVKINFFEVGRSSFTQGEKISIKINLESAMFFRTFERYQTSINFTRFFPK